MDYQLLASKTTTEELLEHLTDRNITGHLVPDAKAALAKIFEIIPPESEIATASSETLRDIGLIDVLKKKEHPWKNIKDNLFTEIDHLKREELRRESILADYNIQSCQAITQTGQLIFASGMGNQIAAISYASRNIIVVAGTHKIVPTLEDAMQRVNDYVIPLEDARMKRIGFKKGTTLGKLLIFEKETRKRAIHLILVEEVLGY